MRPDSSDPSAAGVLQRISARVAARLAERKARLPLPELAARAAAVRAPSPFSAGFPAGAMSVIAEVKFASPSRGVVREGASAEAAARIAGAYLAAGAAAISVLTEPEFFGGRIEFLAAIRAAHPRARLLLKDFVLDEYMLLEAKLAGADAALLIVSLLGENACARLSAYARSIGMEALVEVHDDAELAIAERIGARLIGVNNRDLSDLRVSLDVSERLAPRAPKDAILVSESGIERPEDLARLRAAGFRGALVGTSLMRAPSPGSALARLREVAGPEEASP